MRPRSVVIALALAAVVGCTSPGKPVENRDLKLYRLPAATPAQPAIGHTTAIGFTLLNVDRARAFDGVVWTAYRDPVDPLVPTGGTPVATGTVSLGVNAVLVQGFTPAETSGTHRYAVVIDPAGAIAERDETNNSGSVTVVWADLDIAFAARPSLVSPHLDPSNQVTVSFSIANTPTPGGAAPSSNVTWQVTQDGVAVGSATVAVASGATVPVQTTFGSTPASHTYVVTLTTPDPQARIDNDSATFTATVDTGI